MDPPPPRPPSASPIRKEARCFRGGHPFHQRKAEEGDARPARDSSAAHARAPHAPHLPLGGPRCRWRGTCQGPRCARAPPQNCSGKSCCAPAPEQHRQRPRPDGTWCEGVGPAWQPEGEKQKKAQSERNAEGERQESAGTAIQRAGGMSPHRVPWGWGNAFVWGGGGALEPIAPLPVPFQKRSCDRDPCRPSDRGCWRFGGGYGMVW